MAESETLISIDEYLHTDYSPDCDYVDGVVEERNLGKRQHSRLQIALGSFFWTREAQLGITAYTEQRLRVGSTRFRVPDVCVYIGDGPEEEVFTSPPFICIEILSPEDRMVRVLDRIMDYLKFGVRYIWVIDPVTLHATAYTNDGVHEITDGILRTTDPEIIIPLKELRKVRR